MRLTKIPAVFIICIGLAISSVAKADEACVTPSGYYYNEGLEFNISNVFSQINPRLNLNLYLSTKDNLSQYQNTSKPKLFPDGEIIIYLPTQYANRERGSGTGGGGGTYIYSEPDGGDDTGTVILGIVTGEDLNSIEKILPQTFSSFKRGLLRNGYISNFLLTDDYSKKFSQQFNQYYKPSLVNLKSLGTIVNENFSFATMGITTHKINGEVIKFARVFGAIYKHNKQTLQYILISKKLSNEQDNSEVQQIQKDFQNIMTGIRNCIYSPNVGSRFVENYKSSIYEGELQEPSQDVQSESSEPVDYIEKLREIKSLLDDGIINEEDFEKMKQKIIDNM